MMRHLQPSGCGWALLGCAAFWALVIWWVLS